MKKNMQKEGVGSLLCGHRVDQKSLDQQEPDSSGRVTQRQGEGALLGCSSTFWWRWDNRGEVVFSPPSLQFPVVLFKIAHMAAENSSLLIPGLYLDAILLSHLHPAGTAMCQMSSHKKPGSLWTQLSSLLSLCSYASFHLSPQLSLFLRVLFSLSVSTSVSLIDSQWSD